MKLNNNINLEQLCIWEKEIKTDSFCNGASLSFRVLRAVREALDSGGEIKLAHLLAKAAVSHVGLGGQIHWSVYENHNINLINKLNDRLQINFGYILCIYL